MRALIPAAAATFVLSFLVADPPAFAAEAASDCVQMTEAPVDGGLKLAIDNHCPKNLVCKLSWAVQCSNASGKPTRRLAGNANVSVAKDASSAAVASAASCGDNWSIDDIQWECRSATAER